MGQLSERQLVVSELMRKNIAIPKGFGIDALKAMLGLSRMGANVNAVCEEAKEKQVIDIYSGFVKLGVKEQSDLPAKVLEMNEKLGRLTATLKALREKHPGAFCDIDKGVWCCPRCNKTALDAPTLTKRRCKK